MIDLSFAGLLGAILGTVVAAVAYGPLVVFCERRFRSRDPSQSPEERTMFEQEVSILRRVVLAADIILFAGFGYWFGAWFGAWLGRTTGG
jgi:hypothetical protein